MSSNLIAIGSSGARAAREALDVASQNIANAATDGYVRRSVRAVEVASTGTIGGSRDASLSGVRVNATIRHADAFRQSEVRRTSSELSRADAELSGLDGLEMAIENSGLFGAAVGFEGALQQLTSNPVSMPLRAAALQSASTLASSFTIAATQVGSIGDGLRVAVADGVSQANLQISELAKLNAKIARTSDGTSNQAVLLDQRDGLLRSLSETVGISTRFAANATVEIRLGDAAGPLLVSGLLSGTTTQNLSHTNNVDGSVSFAVGGTPVSFASGSLAGQAQGLAAVSATQVRLDSMANGLSSVANAAQASGVGLDGTPGQPFFAGTSSKDIALALSNGSQIATAPAGAAAGSLNGSNLASLRAALSAANPSDQANSLLFDTSTSVAGRKITRSALDAIASSASLAVNAQSAVDLDQEAANLLRYQQAFQASAKVIQVASTIFDTLLATR